MTREGVSNPFPATRRYFSHGGVLRPTFPAMAMIWDAPLTAALAAELNELLSGARLRSHSFRWKERELLLYFRSGTLRWSLHPGAGWLTFLPGAEPAPDARPLAAEVLGVEAPPDERLIRFRMRRVRGKVREAQIVIELMTNQWNALLMEGEDMRIRHLLWTRRSGDRTLAVGGRYEPPPASSRAGVDPPMSPGEWEKVVAPAKGEAQAEGQKEAGAAAFLDHVAFSSPLNLRALLAEECAQGQGACGYPLWLRLRSLERPEPGVLVAHRTRFPYPFPLQGYEHRPSSTLLEAIASVSQGQAQAMDKGEGVLEQVERALHRAESRARGLRRELERSSDPEESRELANLLLARLRDVPRGVSTATLRGFDGDEVVVELDPSRSPHENAQALYEEAARMERARNRLPPLLERAQRRIAELSRLRDGLMSGEISPLEAEALLPAGKHGRPGPSTGTAERLPFLRYRSSGGLEIRVGRGSRDNDSLTFRHARPDDVWLHARDSAGAHVVLRWSEAESPPFKDLSEAAVLAALHSRARDSGVVPVDWTRRKYVRKPRKAPPGAVLPGRVKTLFVEPDPSLPDRLRWSQD